MFRSFSVGLIGVLEREYRENGGEEVIKEIKIKFFRIKRRLYLNKSFLLSVSRLIRNDIFRI